MRVLASRSSPIEHLDLLPVAGHPGRKGEEERSRTGIACKDHVVTVCAYFALATLAVSIP